jgi:cyclohexanecarboxylate-CoA ligase
MSARIEPQLSADRIDLHERAGEWPRPAVSALLDRRVTESPSDVFLVDGDERISFGEFADRVERLTASFRDLGIGSGDVVSWQLPSWWEAAVVAVTIDQIGAINNPILPIYRESEVRFVAQQASTRMLVVPGLFRGVDYPEMAVAVRSKLSDLEHIVVARGEIGDGMLSLPSLLAVDRPLSDIRPVARDPNEVAMLFYTSGTTADPKGVMHTASTIGSYVTTSCRVAGNQRSDVGLLQFPLTHIGGLASFLLLPLLVGSRVVYLDAWDAERALSLIESEGVTGAGGPPAILQGLLAAKGFSAERVQTVRTAASGAADIPPDLIREIRRRFDAASYRAYGLTECPMLTTGAATDPEEKCSRTDGRPAPGCTVRVVDDNGTVLPSGVEGEIEAFGPQLCVGYLDSTLTAEAFTGDGFLRTGDLGVIDADGYVRVTGRKKDIIIRKGENLSAKAIEDILHAHPAVAQAAVIGVPDAVSGERVCACLVMRRGSPPLRLEDVREFMVIKKVMRQKIPEQVEVLPELPRNATGKVLKHKLRDRFG